MSRSSTRACSKSSIGFDVALFDERAPSGVVVPEELAKLRGRARLRFDALGLDALPHLRVVQGLLHLDTETVERARLQVRRREDAIPGAALVIGQSLLGDRRQIGRAAVALERTDAENLQLARLG